MACFVVPTAAAVAATAFRKKIPPQYHFDKLLLMLWGGTIVLIIDHLISGELVPYWPFLTAGYNQIMPEILEVGVPMTVAVVAVWLIIVAVSLAIAKKQTQSSEA